MARISSEPGAKIAEIHLETPLKLSMSGAKSTIERELHRRIGIKCFNGAWKYLDKKRRTDRDDMEMLLLAHTSLYHWRLIGTPRNLVIGEWQLSRAYAKLGVGPLSLVFAKTALGRAKQYKLLDLLPSAHEGMARAYSVTRNTKPALEHVGKALKALEKIRDREDRRLYSSQIKDTIGLITSRRAGTSKA